MPFVLPTSTPTDSTSPFRSGTASRRDRKSTRLNSSHLVISYAVFCLKKKNTSVVVESYGSIVRYNKRLLHGNDARGELLELASFQLLHNAYAYRASATVSCSRMNTLA